MKNTHAAAAIAGGLLAIAGGISLLNSRTQKQGKIRLSLMLVGFALLPVSVILYVNSRD